MDLKSELLEVPDNWPAASEAAVAALAAIYSKHHLELRAVKLSPFESSFIVSGERDYDVRDIAHLIECNPVIKQLGTLTLKMEVTGGFEPGDIIVHNGQRLVCTSHGYSTLPNPALFRPI